MWLVIAERHNQAFRVYALKHAFADKSIFTTFRTRHEKLAPPFWDAIREAWPIETAIFAQQPAVRTAIVGLVRCGHDFLQCCDTGRCPDSDNAARQA